MSNTERKGLFKKQVEFKPFHYPQLLQYREAIKSTPWHAKEYSYEKDIQDFKVNLSEAEKEIAKRTMLAIAQVESASVKHFWGKIHDVLPRPEIAMVGYTFAENEIVHSESYSMTLDLLGFNDEFEDVLKTDVIGGRVDYLEKYLRGSGDNIEQFSTLKIALFSLFVENVSLFGQFFILKSFKEHQQRLEAIDNVVSATMKDECYIEGTEVLTPNGWKLISEIKVGDDIYQYNNGVLEKTKVLRTINKHFKGNLIKFSKNKHQTTVTPNHDMVYYNEKGDLIKVKAKDFVPSTHRFIPESAPLLNTDAIVNNLSFYDRLKIAIQADGNHKTWKNKEGSVLDRGIRGGYNYSISIYKKRKVDRLDWILSNLNFDYNKKEYFKNDKKYYTYSIKLPFDTNFKQLDWVDVSNKSSDWCKDFISEISEWDGYKINNGKTCKIGYSTTNEKCVDIVQMVAILAGYRTSVSRIIDNRSENFSDCYKISFIEGRNNTISHSLKKEEIPYDGIVSCVTVDSGIILTRYNKDTFIAGNCVHASFGMELINIIKQENPEWFDEDFFNKIKRACKKAYDAEAKIIDWIFGEYELDFITKDEVKEFLKRRFNESLEDIGCEKVFFDLNKDLLSKSEWMYRDILAYTRNDFFNNKSVLYNRKSITKESIIKGINLFKSEL